MSWAWSSWSWGETARRLLFPGTSDETDNAVYSLESCMPASLLTSSHCFHSVVLGSSSFGGGWWVDCEQTSWKAGRGEREVSSASFLALLSSSSCPLEVT